MNYLARLLIIASVLAGPAACDDITNSPTETVRFTAQLSPANEIPPVSGAEATGSGTLSVSFNVNRDSSSAITNATADFSISLTGFPAGTALTGAHIHAGTVGINGDIVINTGLASGEAVLTNGTGTVTKNGIALTPSVADQVISNPSAFYFNVHTAVNPNGVARGQLVRQ